jgi:hypothetical protein
MRKPTIYETAFASILRKSPISRSWTIRKPANPAVAIARSLTNTFSGIRPIDLPGFIAAQLIGAICGMALAGWLLHQPGDGRDPMNVEARS